MRHLPVLPVLLVVIALLATGLACGGSKASTPIANGGGEGDGDTEPEKLTEEQVIRRAQLASCGPMCERLVDCSVEDLRSRESEAEIAEMQLEQIIPRAVEDCNDSCGEKTLSPRQIRVVQECVNGPAACGEYLTCLDKANRGS